MSMFAPLEKSLQELFVDKAPRLPEKTKDALAQCIPYVALILGLLTLSSLWALWSWSQLPEAGIDSARDYSRMFQGDPYVSSRMSVSVWVGLIALAAESVLYLAAFSALQARKKSGWDMLFYAALVSLAYGVILLFIHNGIGSFISRVVVTGLGLYFLFQVRSLYKQRKTRK